MYEAFYGLTSKPFQLKPDARFFFLSGSHKRALSYMRYGLSQGEGFIVVTGAIGTGKTTLVQGLFAELDPTKVVAAKLVTTQLDDADLLRMVAAAFGLEFDGLDKATLLTRFEQFLRERAAQGKRVLLVIDEAQNLPIRAVEELRMLSNFEWDNRPLLQSFLVGQQEFRITLHSPLLEQLRQRVIASCDLRPLSAEETAQYVWHRLQLAGWDGNPQITDEALQLAHGVTGGTPRRINLLLDRTLLYGYLEELHELSADVVRSVATELSEEMARPDDADMAERTADAVRDEERGELDARVQRLERAIGAAREVFGRQAKLLDRVWDYK